LLVSIVQLVKLILAHGVCATRTVATAAEVATTLAAWQPHLLILDMDLDGPLIMEQIGAKAAGGARLPVIALTRRGDLKTKLAAFECGADDIVTTPFAPEGRACHNWR
jgi:DNA-binding response OmpR family regulator